MQPALHEGDAQGPVAAGGFLHEEMPLEGQAQGGVGRRGLGVLGAEGGEVGPGGGVFVRTIEQQFRQHAVATDHGFGQRGVQHGGRGAVQAQRVAQVHDRRGEELHQMRPAARLGVDAVHAVRAPEAAAEDRHRRLRLRAARVFEWLAEQQPRLREREGRQLQRPQAHQIGTPPHVRQVVEMMAPGEDPAPVEWRRTGPVITHSLPLETCIPKAERKTAEVSWTRTLRQMAADLRKQERETQKRQKEQERRGKELEKLSELERAKLEVDAYGNQLEVLLSIHKEHGPVWDWITLAASLPPPCPCRLNTHELQAKQSAMVAPPQLKQAALDAVDGARAQDDQEYQEAVRVYETRLAEHRHTTRLAHRIVAGDVSAYTEAIEQLSPFAEIAHLGSSVHFTIHTPTHIECNLKVNGSSLIPAVTKSLTASGKVTVKPMPRARFHEIYQDHVCGCILRVAREVFALLPVKCVLITATVDTTDSATGQPVEQPVMSVAIPRATAASLDFGQLDPSDTLESLVHRGDFKATRKTEAFLRIVPLTLADLRTESENQRPFTALFAQAQQLRVDIQALAHVWTPDRPKSEEITA